MLPGSSNPLASPSAAAAIVGVTGDEPPGLLPPAKVPKTSGQNLLEELGPHRFNQLFDEHVQELTHSNVASTSSVLQALDSVSSTIAASGSDVVGSVKEQSQIIAELGKLVEEAVVASKSKVPADMKNKITKMVTRFNGELDRYMWVKNHLSKTESQLDSYRNGQIPAGCPRFVVSYECGQLEECSFTAGDIFNVEGVEYTFQSESTFREAFKRLHFHQALAYKLLDKKLTEKRIADIRSTVSFDSLKRNLDDIASGLRSFDSLDRLSRRRFWFC